MGGMEDFMKMLAGILAAVLLFGAFWFLILPNMPFGFAREVTPAEKELRMQIVSTADSWLGTQEGSDAHAQIIQIYNSHEPLAQGYAMKIEDNWCAAFGSFAAIKSGLTDIIPTECVCERQTVLWQERGRWEERDNYVPLPGDYIYYAWDEYTPGDCTGWADHVGIVTGTWGPFIRVIEGNWQDSVSYHYVFLGDINIRGYGLPDYASKIG